MAVPDRATLRRLLRWEPSLGVVSVYVEVDLADRGGGWLIPLRNGLRDIVRSAEADGDHELKTAMRATAERVERRFEETEAAPRRGEVGFVAVGAEDRDLWYSLNAAAPTEVVHDRRPHVHGLLGVLDEGAPRGVAVLSAERLRLLSWSLEGFDELADAELEAFILDWRERKARVPRDPAQGQGTSSSGRDRYRERLGAQRERFLRESGKHAAEVARPDWRELIVFGAAEHFRAFADGFKGSLALRHVGDQDLISVPDAELRERVEAVLPQLNRAREEALLARVLDEARGGTRGSVGIAETAQALLEGRVAHLLYDEERTWEKVKEIPEPPLFQGDHDGDTVIQRMLERALETDADVTPLDGEPAAELAAHEGVAALLRY